MSDTYRRYRAIKQGRMQFYQPRPTGQREHHLNTLVAMLCGLTGGQRAPILRQLSGSSLGCHDF